MDRRRPWPRFEPNDVELRCGPNKAPRERHIAASAASTEDKSNADDGDQIFEGGEVPGGSGVEPGIVRLGGRGN